MEESKGCATAGKEPGCRRPQKHSSPGFAAPKRKMKNLFIGKNDVVVPRSAPSDQGGEWGREMQNVHRSENVRNICAGDRVRWWGPGLWTVYFCRRYRRFALGCASGGCTGENCVYTGSCPLDGVESMGRFRSLPLFRPLIVMDWHWSCSMITSAWPLPSVSTTRW